MITPITFFEKYLQTTAMAAQKRTLEDSGSSQKHKKSKVTEPTEVAPVSQLVPTDIDFPRGGGTSFTPLEVKTIRAEAVKEADNELFKVRVLQDSVWLILNVSRTRRNPKRPRSGRESQRPVHLRRRRSRIESELNT